MGIRGLTTFINSNSRQYLEDYYLHDTYIVIDGFNIASHLYTWHCKRNDCFGGDYDKYSQTVHEFFKLLETCKVIPIILFDGGYENKKLKTIYNRLKSKIKTAKHLNSVTQGGLTMFPLFLRDLFVNIVLQLGLKAFQCDLEADYEMACVAKSLNCPVLSYDSDFYIFNVLYIPFSTFEMTFRKVKQKDSSVTSYFIPCQIYRIEKFLKSVGGLSKDSLPLLGTLLGNDYIRMSVFHQFYSELKLPKNKKGKSCQQIKILGVIKWLRNETYESAVIKILSKLKFADRRGVAEQIKISTETYLNHHSEVLQYLNLRVFPDESKKSNTFIFNSEKYLKSVDEVEVDDNVSTDGESEEDSLETPELVQESKFNNNNIPDWFKQKFRTCEYPQTFMDILCHNVHICTPQVEDYNNISSHTVSFPVLSAIQKILTPGSEENLICALRSDYGERVSNTKIPMCIKSVPKLSDVILLTPEEAKAILFDVLDMTVNESYLELLNILPPTWQLYFISIIYWIENAKPTPTMSHIYSLILCIFVLNKIDPHIGFYRSTYKFTAKFAHYINSLVCQDKCVIDTVFEESLNHIDYNESLLSFKELIEYFQMNQKMRSYGKLFDIHVLDCFAQFQSCLIHIKYLNTLLNKPFSNFIISDFYDGTFLFNMCLNLNKRTDIGTYLRQTLLKYSPNIFNCITKIIELLCKVVQVNVVAGCTKKRRKRKKLRTTVSDEDCININNESDEENVIDVNNRFSILSMRK